MDKSTHEGHIYQSLQTNKKQFKIAVTLLTGYNGRYNVPNSNNKNYSQNQLLINMVLFRLLFRKVSYENENLIIEIRRIIFGEGMFSETDYPFTINQIFQPQVVS